MVTLTEPPSITGLLVGLPLGVLIAAEFLITAVAVVIAVCVQLSRKKEMTPARAVEYEAVGPVKMGKRRSTNHHSACRSWPSVPFPDQPRSEATYPTTLCHVKPLGDWMAFAIGFQVNSQLKEEQSTKESRGWRTTSTYLPLLSSDQSELFSARVGKKAYILWTGC